MIISNVIVQESLGENSLGNQLTEPSQASNEIQVWTKIMEQKNNDIIAKMDNKQETILKEIRTNKSASTITNPRSETLGSLKSKHSGSKEIESIGVRLSHIENSESEDEDHPLRVTETKGPKHPARPLNRNELDLNDTILPNEDSEEEDYQIICETSQSTSK